MEDLYDAGCGPMPTFCIKWPCAANPPSSRILTEEDGWIVCPLCKGSYGAAKPAEGEET